MELERVLEARIMANVEELSIADVISTEADDRRGYMARFAPVVTGGIKDYDGKVEWDQAKVAPVELTLNEKKYFASGLDDVEALKTNPVQIEKTSKRQARAISRSEDEFLLAELAKGAGKTISRTLSSPSKAYEAVVDANKELSKLDAPLEDRFVIVDYDTLGLLEKDPRFTAYESILANGLVQGANVNGSMVLVTNALPENTILAVQKDGVGFERFIDKLEVMRLESAFADGLRGLSVFDGVVLAKDFIVKVTTGTASK